MAAKTPEEQRACAFDHPISPAFCGDFGLKPFFYFDSLFQLQIVSCRNQLILYVHIIYFTAIEVAKLYARQKFHQSTHRKEYLLKTAFL